MNTMWLLDGRRGFDHSGWCYDEVDRNIVGLGWDLDVRNDLAFMNYGYNLGFGCYDTNFGEKAPLYIKPTVPLAKANSIRGYRRRSSN